MNVATPVPSPTITISEEQPQVQIPLELLTLPMELLRKQFPTLTGKELKRLRAEYVTVRLPRGVACGHRVDPRRSPRHRNCYCCWMAFFEVNADLVKTTDELIAEHGESALVQFQDEKYLKYFRLYKEVPVE